MSKSLKVFIKFFIVSQITSALCDMLNDLEVNIERLKKSSQQLYGNHNKDQKSLKEWELDLEDNLSYPRGQREKIAAQSAHWSNYYECTLHRHRRMVDKRTPSLVVMVYEGAVARFPCELCLSPEEVATWMYAVSSNNLTFVPMEEKDTIVTERDGNITIYHTTNEDAGVYQCQVGDSVSGMVFLEVVDYEENYTVVKPRGSHGPFPAPRQTLSRELTLLSAWSRWSECSRCGAVGRRRRYGICTVTTKHNNKTSQDNTTRNDGAMDIFTEFPEGIPCRSKYLPEIVKNNSLVQQRPSEIMIGLCKVPCNDSVVFEVHSATGELIEQANNSAGVYSLLQTLPPQPPPPPSDVMFVRLGDKAVVRCPGTTLRDMPVSWRAGSGEVVPRGLHAGSAGRVYINARDHLVITAVSFKDQHLYSCWQAGCLAGRVEVSVWIDMWRCEPRTVLVGIMLTVLFATKALYRVYTRKLAR